MKIGPAISTNVVVASTPAPVVDVSDTNSADISDCEIVVI